MILALDTSINSATVVVRRNLDTLFDRVDFATMDGKRIGREMLQSLIDGSTMEIVIEK